MSIRGPGSYTLKKEMSASGAIAALLDDANRSDNTVTVTPGQTKDQVAEQISMVANIPLDQVKSAMADTAALGLPAEANGNVEGWLAPGSYELAEGATATSLISQMITRTTQRLDGLGVAAADREKILTKASILEREVRNTEYLPMVSRVIDNRAWQMTNGRNPRFASGWTQLSCTVLARLVESRLQTTLLLRTPTTPTAIRVFLLRQFPSPRPRQLKLLCILQRAIGCTSSR